METDVYTKKIQEKVLLSYEQYTESKALFGTWLKTIMEKRRIFLDDWLSEYDVTAPHATECGCWVDLSCHPEDHFCAYIYIRFEIFNFDEEGLTRKERSIVSVLGKINIDEYGTQEELSNSLSSLTHEIHSFETVCLGYTLEEILTSGFVERLPTIKPEHFTIKRK